MLEFYILDTGYLLTDKNNVVAASTMATRSNPDVKHTFYRLPVMNILIHHDKGWILYDVGSHPDAMKGHWPECLQEGYQLFQTIEQRPEVQLALCGLRPEDIDTVILSHMHFDHTGNIHLYKNADVYVPKADFEFSQSTVHQSTDPTTYVGYCKKDLEVPVRQYILVEDEFEIVPGVEVINLPGHTPGLLGLVIHLEQEGTYIFPMDAVYTCEIYGPPAKASGLLHNRSEYFKSIEKVRRLEKKYNATVIPAHDWDLFQTLKKAPYCHK